MIPLQTLRYHLRLQADVAALGALLFPPLIALGMTVQGELLPMAELFFVLPAPLLVAAVMSREWEAGTADVLLARPAGRIGLLLNRLVAGLAYVVLAVLLGWAMLALRGASLSLAETLAVVLPGGLALGLVGLAVATAARSSPAGYLTPMAWWLLDWVTGGSLTGRLYLFDGLSAEKWWLVGLGALGLVVSAWLLTRQER